MLVRMLFKLPAPLRKKQSLKLIQTAAVSSGKRRRLRKTHASICKKKFAVSCGRLNEPLHKSFNEMLQYRHTSHQQSMS